MAETYAVKPKLRPSFSPTAPSPESKYWKSFKTPKDIHTNSFTFPLTSLSFSPVAPHDFAAAHSASISIFSGKTLDLKSSITAFSDAAASTSFRCDGKLLAAGDLTGTIHVFEAKSRSHLRRLKGHAAGTRLVCYPHVADKFHLFSGGDDSVVKYWDVTTEKCISELLGHKDYVRCGDASPASDQLFASGSYDHRIRLWDLRASNTAAGSVMELSHEKPVESVIYLPSGGLLATAGGNSVKIWDVIGGGKLLYSMESHNKTVTALCMGKVGKECGEAAGEYRILSVSLDGYMKVFDYAKFKITYSMRFPEPLLSVGFSADCRTRVIGSSKGTLYVGRRRKVARGGEEEEEGIGGDMGWEAVVEEEQPRRPLGPSYFRYFSRGQNQKPGEGDYLIRRPKKVRFSEHDKLLKKFRHKEALVAALEGKNPESAVAVMEELVARKKLLKCVLNLDREELGALLGFVQRYATMARYAGFLVRVAKKVVEVRAEDIRCCGELRGHIRNLKRDAEEEMRVQQSLVELQGLISPMQRIAAGFR
ncbi:protein SLOW WALKER 1 [Andrographis paniculata]|uniref:protein SLOW WALKER 1 n=1 Tax=Andrographis paniculata TaxID=175694 RepID=UPI0021E7F321|nr:protein SLOW WALKER 1 [Andrographis paniculata]